MNQKQKIIVIGPGYPYRNGQSVYLAHLCKKLSSEFTIELLNYTLLYPDFLFPGSTQYDEGKDRQIVFPNKRMLNSIHPLSWWKTARYIKEAKPDMIAIDWWHPFFGPCIYGVTSMLPGYLRKRILFITENVISHEASKGDKMLTRLGLKHAQCFLALSGAVEKQLKEMFRRKVFRSALPIYDFYNRNEQSSSLNDERLRAKFGFEPGHKVLLFFGLVRKYKGLDILLRAFSSLVQERKDVRLLIAGEFYEDDGLYRDIIKQEDLTGYIRIENRYIPDEDVARYFHVSDAVVMPYRSATQSGIMSIAYGFFKPVVVTDVGELGAWVKNGETGYAVPPENPTLLKDAMLQLLSQLDAGKDFKPGIAGLLNRMDTFGQVNGVFQDILRFLGPEK